MPYGGNILWRAIDYTKHILKILEADILDLNTHTHTHTADVMCWLDYSVEKCALCFLPP